MGVPACAVALAALAFACFAPASPALAACTPTSGVVVAGGTVTCSGTTTDQDAPDGYGTGTQSNITINVQTGASVTGTAGNGLNLNNNNTVNNSGTITGNASNSGIESGGILTLNNFSGAAIIGNGTFGIGVHVAGSTANVTNYGSITGNLVGIDAFTANVTNYGTVTANGAIAPVQAFGIRFDNGTVTNYGTITGRSTGGGTGIAVDIITTGTFINWGTVNAPDGTGTGVKVELNGGPAPIYNYGTIAANTASGTGVFADTNSSFNLTNKGTISGFTGVQAAGGGAGSTLINSGKIIGYGGNAIDFSTSANDTLTFLPGSKIVGDMLLGTNDALNFNTGPGVSTVFRFGYCGCNGIIASGATVRVTGTQPYVVNGDNVAVIDPTMLSQADKTLMFFTGNVSSLLGSRFGEFGAMGTPGAAAFAAAGASPVAEAANTAFGSLAYAGNPNRQASLPAAMAYDRATGTTVWSKAFVGTRRQDGDDTMLKTSTVTYGGVLGLDRPVGDNLLLGAFLGGGYGVMDVALSSQRQTTDYVFGGVYGRFDWVSHFVDFVLSGGYLSNGSKRLVFNNAAPNGEESATASYNAFYVTPEIAYGWRIPLAGTATLTPVGRLRYIAGHFNGYTETGSFANLTVNGRTVQDLEQRGELMLSFLDPIGHGAWLKTTATAGVLGLERLGGTTINTVLLGQSLSFAAAGKSFTTGIYGGLSLDYRTAQAISVFAAVDATAMSDNSVAFTAKSGTRISF
jgi:hypothetical protein